MLNSVLIEGKVSHVDIHEDGLVAFIVSRDQQHTTNEYGDVVRTEYSYTKSRIFLTESQCGYVNKFMEEGNKFIRVVGRLTNFAGGNRLAVRAEHIERCNEETLKESRNYW